jgi:hypothetical protein
MLHFGNQVEKNKHILKQSWAESELFFHMSPCDIYYVYFSYKHSPHARNTVVLFFSFWWQENSTVKASLTEQRQPPKDGQFSVGFSKLVAMTKSTIYSLVPYHSYDHRP